MFMNNLLTQSVSIFLLIAAGYTVRKRGILSDREVKGLTNLIVTISMPSSIIMSMAIEFSKDKLIFAAVAFGFNVIGYFLKGALANAFVKLFKIEDFQVPVYKLMIMFSNCGFMGIPVAGALFGSEGLFYAAIVNVCFNIFLWTLGIKISSEGQNPDSRISAKVLLKNPGIMSVGIGLALFMLPFDLPKFVETPMSLLAATTTPLAMISVGAFMVDTDIKSVFRDKNLIASTIVRLVVFPMIYMSLIKVSNLPETVGAVLLILESMPAAVTVAIFARQFDSDYELASKGIFLTTLFSLFTIPAILYAFLL